MFFERYPYLPYPLPIGDKQEFRLVKDITLNIRFKRDILDNISLYDEYDIEEGETPEIIAEKLYSDANLYWIIMLYNERYDVVNDFPLPTDVLHEYVTQKYGEGNEYKQHYIYGMPHWETPDGLIVDEGIPFASAITNFDYEFNENEKKRRIRVISPKLIDQIVREADDLMQNA